jgi:deoxyribodipyrimidine photo-lyase
MSRAVVLFTRDLRVGDQQALAQAARASSEIIPLFVLEPRLLSGNCGSPNRLAFLLDCLCDLDASLAERGGHLLVRRGEVVEEVLRCAQRWDADAIYMSADATPYAAGRLARLQRACEQQRVALHCLPGATIVAHGELTPPGRDHYRVFTPYWRVWSRRPLPAGARAPARVALPAGLQQRGVPHLRELTRGTPSPSRQSGGERAGRARLASWLRAGLGGYAAAHDDLAAAETSSLSAHLHFGSLSPRSVLERCSRPGAGGEEFARQLCWRDFHHQVLAARPDMPRSDYRPRGDHWRSDEQAEQAWRAGMTGYPIVDAGMRQLALEGFMHNRARLIVASFLTKTLYLDWRTGAEHFARLLTDADVANNVGNWQWVAGTGNDTRPNRVLNPLRQAARFDPRGDYVRRYVPELAGVQGAAVHQPWLLDGSVYAGLHYPARIVDLADGPARLRAGRYGSSSPS